MATVLPVIRSERYSESGRNHNHPIRRRRTRRRVYSTPDLRSKLKVRLSFVKPRQELQPYIESFWVFESTTGIPLADRNLAVPNGCSKLIIPYEISLMGVSNGRAGVSHEHGLYFVGNRIKATLIHSTTRRTGFIGIEFSPHGAFPLFGVPMHETVDEKYLTQRCFSADGLGRLEKLFVIWKK